MSAYPNYSYQQPQMMGYQQNFNQNMQMQNPYMDRSAQMQQFQQGQQVLPSQMPGAYQQPGLIGKMVNDVSMVSPNDVPMDGNIAIFPKNDMSEIYCKQWKQDGTIQTVVYKPVLDQNHSEATNIPQMDFNALNDDLKALRGEFSERFDRMEKFLGNIDFGKLQKPKIVQGQKNNQRPAKPEVNADE